MKRILAIVLSALLLVTTFLSVPFVISAEEIDSTTVDFNEAFYVDAVHTNNGGHNYEYTNGTFSGNKSTIAFAELTTDSEKGNVVKFASIGSSTNDNSGKWVSGFRVADNAGTAPFYVKPDKSYLVSYDMKIVSAGSDFDVALTYITEYNGVGGVSASAQYFPYTAINHEEATATNGWVTRKDIVFTPSWADNYSQLAFFLRKEGSAKYNCEVYFDNITVTEVTQQTNDEPVLFEVDFSYSGYTHASQGEAGKDWFKNTWWATNPTTIDGQEGLWMRPSNNRLHNINSDTCMKGQYGPCLPNAGFRLVNNKGEAFKLEEGKKYKIKYDLYADISTGITTEGFGVGIDAIPADKNPASVAITAIPVSNWHAQPTESRLYDDVEFEFTATASGDARVYPFLYGWDERYMNIYFANISIIEVIEKPVGPTLFEVDFSYSGYTHATQGENTWYKNTWGWATNPAEIEGLEGLWMRPSNNKLHNINGDTCLNGKWGPCLPNAGFRLVNSKGEAFKLEEGKKYKIKYDLYADFENVTTEAFGVGIDAIPADKDPASVPITEIAASNWHAQPTEPRLYDDVSFEFTAKTSGDARVYPFLYGWDERYMNIYFANISIIEVVDNTPSYFEVDLDYVGYDASQTKTDMLLNQWWGSVAEDATYGKYISGSNHLYTMSDPGASAWFASFRLADTNGNVFKVEKGKFYEMICDFHTTCTNTEGVVVFDSIPATEKVYDSEFTNHSVVSAPAGTSSEGTWYEDQKFVFGATASGDLRVSAVARNTTQTQKTFQFANIKIREITDVTEITLNKNNGESAESVIVPSASKFEDLKVPTAQKNYDFGGWFLDANFTQSATGEIGTTSAVYAKWIFVSPINVIDFNEPVYKNGTDFFIYNSSLAEDLNGSGNNAVLLTKARHPSQGWHTAVRIADYAGTGAYQMVAGQAYNIKFSYRVDYAERPHSLYIWVGQNSGNLKPENGKKIASFSAMTDYGDGLFRVYETGIFVAPANGSVHFGFVADAYPDMDNQKLYLDDITIEKLDTPDVKLHFNNGEADKTVKITLIDKHFAIEAPTFAGHTFEGWFTDANLTQPFAFRNLSSDSFNVTDLYAKWSETPTVGYEFETGFEAGETGAYTNNGSDSDKTNNYQNMHSYIDANFDNANTGKGVLVLNGDDGQYVSDSTHYLSTALADKDGKYFQVVKGTRYRLTYSVLLTGNANGNLYTGISTSANVPVGAINATNIRDINQHYSGGTDLTHFEVWYEREVYFIAQETGKVYFWAHVAAPEQVICYDDVKFEIADPDKTALISYYNEDGTPYTYSNVHFTTFGACGEWITEGGYPPNQSKTGYVFDGWRIGSPTGEQFVSNRYPDEDIKLYASWKEAKAIPENPVTPLDENDSVYLDFEDTNATRAFYERGGNATGGYYGLYMVTGDPDKAHSGSNYYQYYHAGHWMKQWYRTMRFYNSASPDGKIWVEPNTTYKISYWYNPDKVGAANLYLANFNSEYADGYEILAENYLADANIFDQFGKWNYYETTVFTGEFKGNLGFVLYGGYFTVAIDDITVTKCQTVEVSFNSNGGTEISNISGMSHHTFIAPEDPEREGYDFAGWFTDAALTKPFDFTKDTVDKAMTLYAKWTAKKYKTIVTYAEKEVEVEVTPEDAHLDDAASFNDTKDKIGTIAGDILEQGTSLAWLWILLACVGGAVVLGGAAILIIVLIKRKKGA